ncbi:MAG: hypothetical protein ABEJ22_08060 [Haloferacaceae archaeon]
MASVVPGHVAGGPSLLAVIVTATLAAGVLVALAAVAFTRRRSRSYLLITLALAALLVQEVIGWLALAGTVSDGTHHLVEHVLDVVLAGLVLAAVTFARSGGESREDT